MPDSVTVCGEFGALSVMLRVPVRVPNVVGVKVTVEMQEAPIATVPQALVSV